MQGVIETPQSSDGHRVLVTSRLASKGCASQFSQSCCLRRQIRQKAAERRPPSLPVQGRAAVAAEPLQGFANLDRDHFGGVIDSRDVSQTDVQKHCRRVPHGCAPQEAASTSEATARGGSHAIQSPADAARSRRRRPTHPKWTLDILRICGGKELSGGGSPVAWATGNFGRPPR